MFGLYQTIKYKTQNVDSYAKFRKGHFCQVCGHFDIENEVYRNLLCFKNVPNVCRVSETENY